MRTGLVFRELSSRCLVDDTDNIQPYNSFTSFNSTLPIDHDAEPYLTCASVPVGTQRVPDFPAYPSRQTRAGENCRTPGVCNRRMYSFSPALF